MKTAAAVAFSLAVAIGVTGCSWLEVRPEHLPEETIEQFEDAVNAMDVNGMLDCLDESAVKTVTAGMDLMMGIAGAVTGVDLGISAEDLIALTPFLQGIVGPYPEGAGYPQIDFQVTETYIKGDKATVYFQEINSGEAMAINMDRNDDGRWLMTTDLLPVTAEEADRVIGRGQSTDEAESDLENAEAEELLGRLAKELLGAESTASEEKTSETEDVLKDVKGIIGDIMSDVGRLGELLNR